MLDHTIPEVILFDWLAKPCPRGDPRKRWRDVVRKDLKDIGVNEEHLYREVVSSRTNEEQHTLRA